MALLDWRHLNAPVKPLDGLLMMTVKMFSHAEVKQNERMIWPLGEIKLEQSVVPVTFSGLPCFARVVAGVQNPSREPHDTVMRKSKFGCSPPKTRENLLMNSALPGKSRQVAKHLDMIH
jgi:hypothetical protein